MKNVFISDVDYFEAVFLKDLIPSRDLKVVTFEARKLQLFDGGWSSANFSLNPVIIFRVSWKKSDSESEWTAGVRIVFRTRVRALWGHQGCHTHVLITCYTPLKRRLPAAVVEGDHPLSQCGPRSSLTPPDCSRKHKQTINVSAPTDNKLHNRYLRSNSIQPTVSIFVLLLHFNNLNPRTYLFTLQG